MPETKECPNCKTQAVKDGTKWVCPSCGLTFRFKGPEGKVEGVGDFARLNGQVSQLSADMDTIKARIGIPKQPEQPQPQQKEGPSDDGDEEDF